MNRKYMLLVFLNSLSFIAMLFINYASNANVFNSATVGDISHKYDTLIAPADYAFIIWSAIFLLCTGFVIYQWVLLKNDKKQYIQRTGAWFLISNIANALWVYCWIQEWLGWCVILILILLFSLVMLTVKLRLELDDEPVRTIFFVWWPISIYIGWIIAATVACVAAWLVYIDWNGLGISTGMWTVIMIAAALLPYIFLHIRRNMREAASVGIWAFVAIAVRQWDAHKNIAYTAVAASVILCVLITIQFHKSRNYSPLAKIKRGEWK